MTGLALFTLECDVRKGCKGVLEGAEYTTFTQRRGSSPSAPSWNLDLRLKPHT